LSPTWPPPRPHETTTTGKKAQKAAQKERIAEEEEAARRIAVAQLDERDRRDRDWCYANLGDLTDHELRRLIRRQHGFEPI
jgi:hypothetical protein